MELNWNRMCEREYVEQVLSDWKWDTSPLHEAPDEVKTSYQCLYYIFDIVREYEKRKKLYSDLNQEQIYIPFSEQTVPTEMWKDPYFFLFAFAINPDAAMFADEQLLENEVFFTEINSSPCFPSWIDRFPEKFFKNKRFIQAVYRDYSDVFEENLINDIATVVNQTICYTTGGDDPGHDGNRYTDFPEAVEMSVRSLLLRLDLFDQYDVVVGHDDSGIVIIRKADGKAFCGSGVW